jgi:ubiquinone/menaquinone biosynthesis C-methylase UbiE
MDALDQSRIIEDDKHVKMELARRRFFIVNPYKEQVIQIEQANQIVEKNLKLLKESDVLLVNLTVPNYTYIGVVFEIVQAATLGLPIIAYIGDSHLADRYYLHAFCDFICNTIEEAVEYIRRCWTFEGINKQIKEEKEFYDKIATQTEKTTRKPYKNKKKDIDRYEKERARLKNMIRDYCLDKNVLELGCGTGEWTKAIAEVAKSIVCIESSLNMIKSARERLATSSIQPDFINSDFFDESLSVKPCDIIVSYFTLSFLPPLAQNELLSIMKKWISKDGFLLFGESIQVSALPSIGLGRQRIQVRNANGKKYRMFKEHFNPYHFQKVLALNDFKIINLPLDVKWFTFCSAQLK